MSLSFTETFESFYKDQKREMEKNLEPQGKDALETGLEIHELTMRHPVLTHPFYRDFYEGKFSLEQTQQFLIAYYQHILHTRHYYQMMMAIASPLIVRNDFSREFHNKLIEIQSVFSLINNDEYNDGAFENTHMGMYERLMKAFGIEEEDRLAPPVASVRDYIAIHYGMALDWYAGIGAVGPGSEWPVPPIFAYFLEGAKKIAARESIILKDYDIEVLTGHIELDVLHAIWIIKYICKYGSDKESLDKIEEGLIVSLNTRYDMMSGIGNEIVGNKVYPSAAEAGFPDVYRKPLASNDAYRKKGSVLFL